MALDFFAGCLGGCAGIVVGYPLDTVKVHMQTQDSRNPKYKSTWHCLRTLVRNESVSGLYRGITSPMAGVAAVNAVIFGVYGQAQRHMHETDHLGAHFLAGASAGIAQTPICSPIELAKTRLQLQTVKQQRFSGPLHCLKHIYRHEGYRGVFNGLGITFLREAPSYGVYFFTYELLTKTSTNEQVSTARMLLAGGLAGTASWVISYPLDVIKSRMQAESRSRYSGAFDCFRQSVRAEGYSFLYRGLNSTIIRAFPTNAATFAVVTWTFRIFGDQPVDSGADKRAKPLAEPAKCKSKATKAYDSFVGRWNLFLQKAFEEKILWRSYGANLSSLVSTSTAFDWPILGNSVLHILDGCKKLSVKCDTNERPEIGKMEDELEEELERRSANDSNEKDIIFVLDRGVQCTIGACAKFNENYMKNL